MEDKSLYYRPQPLRYQSTDLVILVIASNASMQGTAPLRVTKAEVAEMQVCDLVTRCKSSSFNSGKSLAIINYAERAVISMWPTQFKYIEDHPGEFPYTAFMEGEKVCVSEGLEAALRLALAYERHAMGPYFMSYIVLVTDGVDDDPEKTKVVLDVIKQKENIEFYTYFVETLGQSETTKAEFEARMGGEPLIYGMESLCAWISRGRSNITSF